MGDELCDVCGARKVWSDDLQIVGMECPNMCGYDARCEKGLIPVACVSALALGLQVVVVKHLVDSTLEKALVVEKKLREVVRTNECLCEQVEEWRRKHREKIYSNE